jgi:DNA-binding response OmpR family regulator
VRKKILILDNDNWLWGVLSDKLRKIGFDAYSLESKLSGLYWSIANKPDLIICDLKSPEMDGF